MLQHWAGHFLCFALRISTLPSLNAVLPLHFSAIRFFSFAVLRSSGPFLCFSAQHHANPSPIKCQCAVAMPCHVRLSASIAAHGESERFRCCSVPRLTYPLLLRSRRRCAQPFRCETMPGPSLRLRCVTRFPPSGICLFHCCATGQCRRSAHSPASRAQRRCGRHTGRPP